MRKIINFTLIDHKKKIFIHIYAKIQGLKIKDDKPEFKGLRSSPSVGSKMRTPKIFEKEKFGNDLKSSKEQKVALFLVSIGIN